ncbi:BOI-related E3 ubiquitin-protein ligase 1-like isoform X1 [Olea europaea var. sylvestris]|uniref:BOI-related E3 ubiquitin-protein ligase 1-like isoform X1 n=2 Tax=Olea europaea var. sylvestris TaxID=158386 RepID=UPI000C1CD263|nr:BOI-related E3 ubiquitin-protein ligase 1-like isoform X1 [Olea europaea var. sylvestris]
MAIEKKHLNFVPSQVVPQRGLMNSSYQGGSALAYMLQKGSSGVLALGKRTRDSTDRFYAATSNNQFPSIVGDGVSNVFNQVQNYRLDIDSILSQHTKKIKIELETSQNHHARMVVAAIREGVMKKLNEKDEQIQRMDRFNSVLQERLKCLFVENQMYKNLAETNEAVAKSLRTDMEQILRNVGDGGRRAEAEDAESCCDSNACEKESKMCHKCRKKEACVLLLPCRACVRCAVVGPIN